MSLEQTIIDLVAAIRENTAAIVAAKSGAAPAEVKTEEKKPTTAKEAVAQAEAAAKESKAKKEAEAKAKAEAEAAEKSKAEDKAPSYETDVQPKLTAFLSAHGRDAFFALLKPFNAKKGTEVKADDYAAVLAAIDEFDLTA